MMLCYSKIRKIKYFWAPSKRLKDSNGRDMSTRTSVCLYKQPETWIFTRSILSSLSNPFIENYYLIIVVFSCPHFSIYDIFIHWKSFNEKATHFNEYCGTKIWNVNINFVVFKNQITNKF